MGYRNFVLIGVLLCVLLVSGEGENVVVLTDETFQKTIKENEFVLVKIFAPWCGHCQRMASDYSKAADILKSKGSKAVIAELDGAAEKATKSTYAITGFPTLILFKNGEELGRYGGDRTSEGISEYVLNNTGEAVKTEL